MAGDVLDSILRQHLQAELSLSVPESAELSGLSAAKLDELGRVQELVITYTQNDDAGSRQLEYKVTKDKIRWVLRQPDGRILPVPALSSRCRG